MRLALLLALGLAAASCAPAPRHGSGGPPPGPGKGRVNAIANPSALIAIAARLWTSGTELLIGFGAYFAMAAAAPRNS